MFINCLAGSSAEEGRPRWVESHFRKGRILPMCSFLFFSFVFALLSKKLFTCHSIYVCFLFDQILKLSVGPCIGVCFSLYSMPASRRMTSASCRRRTLWAGSSMPTQTSGCQTRPRSCLLESWIRRKMGWCSDVSLLIGSVVSYRWTRRYNGFETELIR